MSSLVSSKFSKRSEDVESETRLDYISDKLALKREKVVEIINFEAMMESDLKKQREYC